MEPFVKDGAYLGVMAASVLVLVRTIAQMAKRTNGRMETICPVNTNGFRAAIERLTAGQERQTEILQGMALDIGILKDRTHPS